ncbi:hypothetical protein HUT16_01755 [Kitasatospora sp. NA04385]|uniref:hypothetical protein n=1 Tax=Kitasatospora sp. NA04385 TaxID=2742135 RepID=UPI001590F095|nr:hypothetical protein [Kitasatospora sp. NA04385]QKW17950.1 hypothetical protein HUT16_01755 [Kitasatospora sp. NA04385]
MPVALLAVLLAAVLALLTAGPPAQARAPRPPASAAAEEHLECKYQQEAQAPAGRSAARHRGNGGPPARSQARPDDETAPGAPSAPGAADPAPSGGGSRPGALARLQVFRC